jgi:hypothetical protein
MVFVVGMKIDCVAPCRSETAHRKDELSGQRANADPENIKPVARMTELNFIHRLPAT